MKKSVQIVGLPIISIIDGQEVGKVKSLVINPEKGSIDFLTIEHEDWQVSVKAIPFKKVVGIGEYAVTVESESAVIDLNEIPIANQLVNKKIKITSTRVMTRKGELLGEVLEYYVDEDTGNILGTLLKIQNKEVALASNMVLTYGKDIVIVKEDSSSHFLESVEYLEKPGAKNSSINAEVEEKVTQTKTDKKLEFKTDPFDDVQLHTEVDKDQDEVEALKQRQIEILKGKMVMKDILNKDGEVLISEGTILSSDHITKAQEEGPSVVVELSMNVEA
ncbi:PRC-barrel domain-containing protein [Bacillus timonensis]|nr:PRC-barrel domain-containing protein [Bacillus timonensis]